MKKSNLVSVAILAAVAAIVVVAVGDVLVSYYLANVEVPPQEGFVIVKKEVLHNRGNLWFLGFGYDIPIFYFSETGFTGVYYSDFDKYDVGDFFSGPYVIYC